MTEVPSSGSHVAAFVALQDLVREWQNKGRTPTTAGIKPELDRLDPPIVPSSLGFADYTGFLDAAADAGYITKYRQANGHWLLQLPGASVPNPVVGPSHDPNRPLKPEVWNAFVNWTDGLDRRWDREQRCAILLPVDSDGAPMWKSDPTRFPVINYVRQEQQTGWMHSFAETFSDPERAALLAALDPERPRGEWQRTLTRLGITDRWRQQLRTEVTQVVEEWAAANTIPAVHLYAPERRSQVAPKSPSTRTDPQQRTVPTANRPARESQTERLRSFVHAAVDEMTFEELAALPIRAIHIIQLAD